MTFAAQFARQILLTHVGAAGQAKLCAASLVADGHDAVSEVASLWLRAGGSDVRDRDVAASTLSLGPIDVARAGQGPWVTWGMSNGGFSVAAVADVACQDCARLNLGTWQSVDSLTAAQEIAGGAWAALFAQRMVLGLTPRFAVVALGESGCPTLGVLGTCVAHKVL